MFLTTMKLILQVANMDDLNSQLKSSMYSEITPFVIELEGRGAVRVKRDSVYELTKFDGSKVQVTGLVSQNGISFFPMSSDIIQTDDMFIEQPFLINVPVENQTNQFVLDEEVAVPPEDVVPRKEFQIDSYETVDNENEMEQFPGFENNISILEFVDHPEAKGKFVTPSVIRKHSSRDIVCEVTPVDLLSTFLVDSGKGKAKTERNDLSVLKADGSDCSKDVNEELLESLNTEVCSGEDVVGNELPITDPPAVTTTTNKRGRPKKEKDVEPPLRKGPFSCDICHTKLATWSLFKAHKDIHLEENKPHVCKVCCTSFNVEKNLKLHLSLHNVGNLTCPECNKTFTRFASFKAHLQIHEEEENMFCSECGDEFTNNAQLERHLQEHRNEWEKTITSKSETKKPLTCKACNRIFTNATSFEYHKKDHQRLRNQLLALAPKRKKRRIRGSFRFGNECKVCNKTFPKPSQLVRHVRIHTGEKPFQCTVCSAAFSQKGSLQIHMSKHNGYKPHVCTCCSLSFSQRGNLITHVNKVHRIPKEGEEIYKCVKCPCSFKKLASLNCHVTRFHIGVKNEPSKPDAENAADVDTLLNQIAELRNTLPNTSDMDILQTAIRISGLPVKDGGESVRENVPNENSFLEQLLQQNENQTETRIVTIADKSDDGNVKHYTVRQRREGNVRWHQCNVCHKEFKKPSDLIRHMRIHTREKPFRCNHCFRTFSIKSTLKSHVRTHESSKLLECKTCGKKVASSRSLKIHLRTHVGIKPFTCNLCSKAFTTSGQLKSHFSTNAHKIRAENNGGDLETVNSMYFFEEPFLVADDGELHQQLSRKEKLISRSQNASSAERPHECEYCHLKFRKSSHLKQHKLQHTGEKPFSCSVCHKNFTTNGVLKMHLKTHSGQKDFECERCSSKFSTKGSLNRHIQTFHSEERPYMCPYCQKRFKTSVNCRKHIKIHRYDNNQHFFGLRLDEVYPEPERGLTEQNVTVEPVEDCQEFKTAAGSEAITQTLLADSTGTITLPSLTQEPLTQESIRELEQTLNHQLFGSGQGSEYTVQMISAVDEEAENVIGKENDFIETSLEAKTLILNVDETIDDSSIVQTVFSQGEELQTVSNMSDILPDTKDAEPEFVKEDELKKDEEKSHVCSVCAKMFTSAQALNNHSKIHSGKKFFCDLCGWSTLTRSSLRRHANIHSDERKFSCSECPAKFRLEVHLRRHLKLHDEESKDCSTRMGRRSKGPFKELSDAETEILAAQDIRHGSSVSEKILIASAAEKLRIDERKDDTQPEEVRSNFGNDCKYCSKSFKKPSDLTRHVRVHTGERPYQCNQCHKCFTVKSTLQSHLRTHYDVKPVSCHICQSMFAAKSSLKVHMRLHTGAKPFQCEICGQRFRTSGHKKNHLLTHAKNKPKNWKKQQLQMLNKIAVALVDNLNEQAQTEKLKDKEDSEPELQQVRSCLFSFSLQKL